MREPHCLYCGYNLTGHADGARCSECGMVSVPAALREEVWGLADSRRRLWVLMARPFVKFPPGWWWALDRPGDVRRSTRTLAVNLALCAAIVFGVFIAADVVVVEQTESFAYYDQAAPDSGMRWVKDRVTQFGWLCQRNPVPMPAGQPAVIRTDDLPFRSPVLRVVETFRITWVRSADGVWYGVIAFAWLVVVWGFVAQVGLWTQIRRGLPEFARLPHTIVAAANLQSCKLAFLAGFVAAAVAAELPLRYACLTGHHSHAYDLALCGLFAIVALAAAVSWVGALRSDYTHQLIRSRLHAARIILMYAVVLPTVTVLALWFGLQLDRRF